MLHLLDYSDVLLWMYKFLLDFFSISQRICFKRLAAAYIVFPLYNAQASLWIVKTMLLSR